MALVVSEILARVVAEAQALPHRPRYVLDEHTTIIMQEYVRIERKAITLPHPTFPSEKK